MAFQKRTLVAFLVVLAGTFLNTIAQSAKAESAFGYNLETDVVYGQGKIAPDGVATERALLLDVYTPSEVTGDTPRPAVILVHGGAYYRGGLRAPPYRELGAVHSRMEDYARLLTPLGYVCFVIEYRLTPEWPVASTPLDLATLQNPDEAITPAGLSRINFVRNDMGLPILADDETRALSWSAVLAAAEDVEKAVDFVRANASTYNVDPEKIAIGGHSAGAGAVVNATYGLHAKVKASFPMSPPVQGFDIAKIFKDPDLPPTLLVMSQNDLEAVSESIPPMIVEMRKANHDYELVWVPGFGHFYPSGAVSLSDDGTRISVGERITACLEEHLK
jgi:dienelactone hydrolase